MTTSTGSYYYSGNRDVSNSATGDTYKCSTKSGTSDRNMFIAFNMKLKNTELAYMLANGGSLTATIEATFTTTIGDNHHGFGVYVGKLDSPATAKHAQDLTNESIYNTKMKDKDKNKAPQLWCLNLDFMSKQ